jgi:hypothetical protein
MMKQFKQNTKGYKILTDSGFQDFAGISYMGDDSTNTLKFENGNEIECSPDHKIYLTQGSSKKTDDLAIGDTVISRHSAIKLVKKSVNTAIVPLFDVIDVANGNRFYANEILVSNCEFISFDETLINPFTLNQMQGIEPIDKTGQVRWYTKPTKGNIYLVALDPSIGTGGDPAAIQVFEAGSNRQVAEWTHNKTSIENQINLLKEITSYLLSITEQSTDIYWSVENNTIGEASLVTIRNIGEENIPGVFLSEPAKLGQAKKFRKGFTTTNPNKLSACAKLKSLVENRKIHLYSRKLISELKTFVSVENTYRAKPGETDDLVTALITIIRMMETLKGFIPELQDIREVSEFTMPLPFLMSTSGNRLY